jgi:ornithine decarboxylase
MKQGTFASVDAMVRALNPSYPVMCVHPAILSATARAFVEGFPGRVLYAVKCNPSPQVISHLAKAGINDFDTASLPEVALVKELLPDANCYFNHPVKNRAAIEAAHHVYDVKHFVIDSLTELEKILDCTRTNDLVIQVRLATAPGYATFDLSLKFGAPADEAAALLRAVKSAGATPALSFHVGSQCASPVAYERAIREAGEVLARANVAPKYLNVGGGFPAHYRGTSIVPLAEFFEVIGREVKALGLPEGTETFCEPGRALVVEGCTLVVQVQLRKGPSLYVNDGIFGSLSELNVGKLTPPTRLIRPSGPPANDTLEFKIFGPTCDSADVLPMPFTLPADTREGDWIEIGQVGAYSNAVASRFNGFFCDTTVEITS